MKLRIGTRGSDLALWQARHVAARLEAAGFEIELVVLKTRGDRIDDVPLHTIEGKAFFTAEIEGALLEGRVDLAVHSHKDLPVEGPPGLTILAVPERADPGERLLVRPEAHLASAPFLALATGATVGTSSPRRAEQLATLRPDLVVQPLRGNVPTRVAKLRRGEHDAILLAAAGLDRLQLDLEGLVSLPLDVETLVPAPAQGALAVQVRHPEEPWTVRVRSALHHSPTAAAIAAERVLLLEAGGGCNLPLGCCVRPEGAAWRAHAFLGASHPHPEAPPRWARGQGPTPHDAVEALRATLLAGRDTGVGPLAGLRVALTGSASGGTRLGVRLAALGAIVHHESVLAFEDVVAPAITPAIARLAAGDALVLTSREAARRLGRVRPGAGVCIAAVGPATAAVLESQGLAVTLVGRAGARELAEVLPVAAGARVLFPCAAETQGDLEAVLAGRGVAVDRLVLYRTRPRSAIRLEDVDARVFLSPSAVHAVAGREPPTPALRIPLGATTAAALRERGLAFEDPEQAPGPGSEPIAGLLHRLLSRAPMTQGAHP